MSLTAPLPTDRRNTEDARAEPWFLVLADGQHCARLSSPTTDFAVLRYKCTDGTFVTQPDRSHQPWTVEDGYATPGHPPTRIAVTRAYR